MVSQQAAPFNPSQPRDDTGRWIDSGAIVSASRDINKALVLLGRTTDRFQRRKLVDQLTTINKAFDPNQPRGDDGRWIDTFAIVDAASSPQRAAALLARTTDRMEQLKLIAALGEAGMSVADYKRAAAIVKDGGVVPAASGGTVDVQLSMRSPADAAEALSVLDAAQRQAAIEQLKSAGMTIDYYQAALEMENNLRSLGGHRWQPVPRGEKTSEQWKVELDVVNEELRLAADEERTVAMGIDAETAIDLESWAENPSSAFRRSEWLEDPKKAAYFELLKKMVSLRRESARLSVRHDESVLWERDPELARQSDAIELETVRAMERMGIRVFSSEAEQKEVGKTHIPSAVLVGNGTIVANSEARKTVKASITSGIKERLEKELSDEQIVRLAADFGAGSNTSHTGPFDKLRDGYRSEYSGGLDEATLEDASRIVTDAWAGSSTDHNRSSVAFQIAVSQKMGMNGHGMDYVEPHILDDAKRMYSDNKQAVDVIVDKVYQDTQNLFERAGVKDLLLFRGMRYQGGKAPEPVRAALSGEPNWGSDKKIPAVAVDTHIRQNPLSSWTSNVRTAARFASQGSVLSLSKAKVPRERIFSSSITGAGCLTEEEYVVLGGDPLPGKTVLSSAGTSFTRSGYFGTQGRGRFLQNFNDTAVSK